MSDSNYNISRFIVATDRMGQIKWWTVLKLLLDKFYVVNLSQF